MANKNQQKVPDLVPINGSTNVYVGQRYVPKFYDDGTEQHGATWDKTKAYEPLTIVLWEGDSYTSRTFVPAGVEITDTQYWLETGNFNAQIELYRALTQEAKNTANNALKLAQATMNRNIITIGDSYAIDNPNREPPLLGWENLLIQKAGKTMNIIKGSVTGIGFNNNGFLNALKNVSVDKPEIITDIVVAGGYNDKGVAAEQLVPLIRNFASYAESTYPNAKLWLFFIARSWDTAYSTHAQLNSTSFIYSFSGAPLAFRDISYLLYGDSTTSAGGNDIVHPSKHGNQLLASAMYDSLIGNSGNPSPMFVHYDWFTTLNLPGYLAFTGNKKATIQQVPAKSFLKIGTNKNIFGNATTINVPTTGTAKIPCILSNTTNSYSVDIGFCFGDIYIINYSETAIPAGEYTFTVNGVMPYQIC